MPTLLEVVGLTVTADDGWSIAVPTLRLRRGETAALYGPSGCGKTTVLQAMFGLLQREGCTTAGSVSFEGQPAAHGPPDQRRRLLRHSVAFLAQDAHAALDPLQTTGQQIRQATDCSLEEAAGMLDRLGVADARALC
ncbi:MAG: ATP-binding cassette domain-containing protein, partial [Planctomycetota bacterium]